ncbi:MAG: Rrf2 family transcriptional regulator [Deltaproteobacteria bacterium]|nr:Rrf2 family transcriptional regulator [Deltaproteobacteria bacterium]
MKLSRECEYGLEGLLFLAAQPPNAVLLLSEVAGARQLPQSFLAKIFQKLSQRGLLRSYRGATRGYALARRPEEISLREVFEAIEGPELFDRCVFWNKRCAEDHPCLLHGRWSHLKPQFVALMEQTHLGDLQRERQVLSGSQSAPPGPAEGQEG